MKNLFKYSMKILLIIILIFSFSTKSFSFSHDKILKDLNKAAEQLNKDLNKNSNTQTEQKKQSSQTKQKKESSQIEKNKTTTPDVSKKYVLEQCGVNHTFTLDPRVRDLSANKIGWPEEFRNIPMNLYWKDSQTIMIEGNSKEFTIISQDGSKIKAGKVINNQPGWFFEDTLNIDTVNKTIFYQISSYQEGKKNLKSHNTSLILCKHDNPSVQKANLNKIKTPSKCEIKKYEDILSCNLEKVVERCTTLGRVNPRSWVQFSFSNSPKSNYIVYPLYSCKNTFNDLFGLKPMVFALWNYDKSKYEFSSDRQIEIFDKQEKPSIVLIELIEPTKEKLINLEEYLSKEKKFSGSINKFDDFNSNKTNLFINTYDNKSLALIWQRSSNGVGIYLAYINYDLKDEIIKSFLITDDGKKQL